MREFKIRSGIEMEVYPRYIPQQKLTGSSNHLFTYQITITNTNPFPVQLLRRHWRILDGAIQESIVEGEGVVGKQPILHQGESHSYSSYCPLYYTFGLMIGHFLFQRFDNEKLLEVAVPPIHFFVDFLNN